MFVPPAATQLLLEVELLELELLELLELELRELLELLLRLEMLELEPPPMLAGLPPEPPPQAATPKAMSVMEIDRLIDARKSELSGMGF